MSEDEVSEAALSADAGELSLVLWIDLQSQAHCQQKCTTTTILIDKLPMLNFLRYLGAIHHTLLNLFK